MAVAALVVGAVASVAGTVMSYQAQKKSAAAQEKQQQVASRHSRREAIRGAQLARAQSVAIASSQGATGSSAALGGAGSVGSQLGSGLGYSTQMSGLSREITKYSAQAQRGADLASIGGTLFNFGYQRNGWNQLKGGLGF